jgi:hypothetical protein
MKKQAGLATFQDQEVEHDLVRSDTYYAENSSIEVQPIRLNI